MKIIYKFREESGEWVILAVDGSDSIQIDRLTREGAQIVGVDDYDFGGNVGSVNPHNTELDQDGHIIRFIPPYSYKGADGEIIKVCTLTDHDAVPIDAEIVDPLDTIKEQKKTEIQDEKKRARDGGVMVDGVLFDTDIPARVAYQEFAMKLAQDPSFSVNPWKASKGIFMTMDLAKFNAVVQAGEQQMQTVYKWQEQQEKAIKSAITPEAIQKINTVFPTN